MMSTSTMCDLDELHDLAREPWELEGIAVDPAYRDVLAEMRQLSCAKSALISMWFFSIPRIALDSQLR